MPGLTNRLLARWVRAAAVTYEETLSYFGRKGFVAGNPVRAEFFAAKAGRSEDRPLHHATGTGRVRLLVLGGSQGAHAINVALAAAAPRLAGDHPSIDIVHQTGERDLAWVRDQATGSPARRLAPKRSSIPSRGNARRRPRDLPRRRDDARRAGGVGDARRAGAVSDRDRRPPAEEREVLMRGGAAR